jgi:hypothetical protein
VRTDPRAPRAVRKPKPASTTPPTLDGLLRAIANDREAGPWAKWARKLLIAGERVDSK